MLEGALALLASLTLAEYVRSSLHRLTLAQLLPSLLSRRSLRLQSTRIRLVWSSNPPRFVHRPKRLSDSKPVLTAILGRRAPQVQHTMPLSRARVFPSGWEKTGAIRFRQTTCLSIIDATTAGFAPTCGIWMYDASEGPERLAVSSEALTSSLQATLVAYPQLAGQLQRTAPDGSTHHTRRFGRFELAFGDSSDPGVEVVIAKCSQTLAALVPTRAARMSGDGVWNATAFSDIGLLPESPSLALGDLWTSAGLPCLIIQITSFACGGVAVAIKFAHPVADAHSLLRFTHDWAATNRALLAGSNPPELSPVFDPTRLDRGAAGDIDAAEPNAAILAQALSLPLHRFDWWASAEGCPPGMLATSQVPPEVDGLQAALGKPIPWQELDVMAPVAHYLVHFSPNEVHRIYEAATTVSSASSSTAHISHLDALLSHVWTLLIRARGLDNAVPVHMNMSIGLRTRLSPPLLSGTLGTPLIIVPVSLPASVVSSGDLPSLATSVRASLNLYTPSVVGALLHEEAFLDCPQRRWNTFLGERHTITTSWLGLGVYDVDFGLGETPRLVDATMPPCDGCVQIMEAGEGGGKKGSKWYEEGVSVSLFLREDAIGNFLADPLLRKYR